MLRNLLISLLLAGAAGCATTGGDSRDPIEGFNRAMFSFNEGFDQTIGKPVAGVYRDVLPGPARTMIRNFFSNVEDLLIGFNNLLQGKPADTVTDWARFAFNSSFGILGLNDVATDFGLEKHNEDFGQTFGRWGAGDGAYIVWPFLGSSGVRDSVGLIFDIGLAPLLQIEDVATRNVLIAVRATSIRADLLDASRILEEAALDKYVFQRDAYLQRRRSLIHDGNPPRASREEPRAETADPEPAAQSVPLVQSAPQPASEVPAVHVEPAAMEAAAWLLERPASAASTGG